MSQHSAEFLRGAKWAFHEAGEPLAASKMSQLLAEAEAREAGATTLEPEVQQVHDLGGAPDAAAVTLRQIAELGGNLTDDKLTRKTGPNDAVQRGLMYVEARRLALEALKGIKAAPDAAAVIATCREALEIARQQFGSHAGEGQNEELCEQALAAIAKYEVLRHEK